MIKCGKSVFKLQYHYKMIKNLILQWLRAVPNGTHTGAHVDRIYMGRGSENLYTTWIPFGDNPPEMGSLCMLHKSNQLSEKSR